MDMANGLELQIQAFVKRGGVIKRLPAGRATAVEAQSILRGLDPYQLRAFARLAKGA